MLNDTVLEVLAKEAIQMEWILSYMRVVAYNPLLSPLNQALVYFQNAKSGFVCGRMAWMAMGREVKSEAIPITLYLPEIRKKEDGYHTEYGAISVFDISATTGETEPKTDRPDIIGRVLSATGATTELIEKEALPDISIHGVYDKGRNTFFLEKGTDRQLQEKTVLTLFIEDYAIAHNIRDMRLVMAVVYALCLRYDIPNDIHAALFSGLNRYKVEEKIAYLIAVGYLVTNLVKIIDGRTLTFDETAYVNALFSTDDKEEMIEIMRAAAFDATDEMIREGLLSFAEKLSFLPETEFKKLYEKRMRREVYSYPASPFPIDEAAYM